MRGEFAAEEEEEGEEEKAAAENTLQLQRIQLELLEETRRGEAR